MNRILRFGLSIAIILVSTIGRGEDVGAVRADGTTVPPATGAGPVPLVFITSPYQQNMSATGMVIMCERAQNIPLRLEYGPTAAYGSAVDCSSEPSGGDTWFYRALITGLKPQRTYHYRWVSLDGASASADALFRTAATRNVDFCFGVWSDSQSGSGSDWTRDNLEPSRSMMRHMAESGVDFGLTCGDLANKGDDYRSVRPYYLDRVARELGPVAPWYAAWGNHDASSTNAVVRRASDMPSRYREGFSSGHGSFSFVYANCFFVCLDHFQPADMTNGWLDQELSSPAAQQARFRIVAIHVPPYSERGMDGDSGLRDRLVPLMEQYHVDLCFSGHVHEYERGATNGVHYVITGGSSFLLNSESIVKDWPHMTVGGAHHLNGRKRKQDSNGELGAPCDIVGGLVHEYCFVQVKGNLLKLECRAFNADGSYIGVLDSFELTAPRQPSRGIRQWRWPWTRS